MASKAIILTVAIGAIMAAGAVGTTVALHAREEEARAAAALTGMLDATPPFGFQGATLTHGPVSVGTTSATIPAFMLVLADGTTLASPIVTVGVASDIEARSLTVIAPGNSGILTSSRMTAKADGTTGELHGVRFEVVKLSDPSGGVKGAAAEVSFDMLSRRSARGIGAKAVSFSKADARGNAEIDIASISLDGLSSNSGDADMGARRLALTGISLPLDPARGAGADSLVVEALPHTGDVTSLSLALSGITSPSAVPGADGTKGHLDARAERLPNGVKMTVSLGSTQMPDIDGEQMLSGPPPASLLGPDSIAAHLNLSDGKLDFQDRSGRFRKLIETMKAADGTHPGTDPAMFLEMAAAMGGIDRKALDPVADWLTDPARKMEVLFVPPATPGSPPGVTVTVAPEP